MGIFLGVCQNVKYFWGMPALFFLCGWGRAYVGKIVESTLISNKRLTVMSPNIAPHLTLHASPVPHLIR